MVSFIALTYHLSLVTDHFFHGDVAQRKSEHRATNAKVVGSSPSVFTKFQYGDECKASSIQLFKLNISGSSPGIPAKFRGRLIGRTTGSEPVDRGSNPFPEANVLFADRMSADLFSGRSTDGYMGLFWKQVFAGSNPAARTISRARSPTRQRRLS